MYVFRWFEHGDHSIHSVLRGRFSTILHTTHQHAQSFTYWPLPCVVQLALNTAFRLNMHVDVVCKIVLILYYSSSVWKTLGLHCIPSLCLASIVKSYIWVYMYLLHGRWFEWGATSLWASDWLCCWLGLCPHSNPVVMLNTQHFKSSRFFPFI